MRAICKTGLFAPTRIRNIVECRAGKRDEACLGLKREVLALALFSLVLLASSCTSAYAHTADHENDVALELSTLGKQGDTIARARGQVLDILQHGNACSAWFQEVNPDPAKVFGSLHFEVQENGPSVTYGKRGDGHGLIFKHPWAARSTQLGGERSVILLNANGPFFQRSSLVMPITSGGILGPPNGSLILVIESYTGDTPEAQITILLHEFGHVVGRLPEDDDSWDGRSRRNTAEVSRRCKAETRAAARNRSIGTN